MLVLALEVAAVVAMGIYYHNVSGQAARLEEQVTQAEHKLHPGRSGARTAVADAQQAGAEIKVANEVIMQLTLPWGELFNALEEANSSNIALSGHRAGCRQAAGPPERRSEEFRSPVCLHTHSAGKQVDDQRLSQASAGAGTQSRKTDPFHTGCIMDMTSLKIARWHMRRWLGRMTWPWMAAGGLLAFAAGFLFFDGAPGAERGGGHESSAAGIAGRGAHGRARQLQD